MSNDKTCWLIGNYVWSFWIAWYLFVMFAISAAIALYLKLNAIHQNADVVGTCHPPWIPSSHNVVKYYLQISMTYVSVVRQSILITFTFFLCWFWNGLFRMFIFANNSDYPHWLVPLQVTHYTLSYHFEVYNI
jgi:hypothetical protein